MPCSKTSNRRKLIKAKKGHKKLDAFLAFVQLLTTARRVKFLDGDKNIEVKVHCRQPNLCLILMAPSLQAIITKMLV